jgi:hypothetical protein
VPLAWQDTLGNALQLFPDLPPPESGAWGGWGTQHIVSPDGKWMTLKQHNSFTHKTKDNKTHTANCLFRLKKVA